MRASKIQLLKKHLLPFLLFFLSLNVNAETDLVLKDPTNYLHYRIDLKSKVLSKEQRTGDWENLGKLQFVNIDLRDFKILTNQTFNERGNILISIEGTGQLFRVDLKRLTFSRIDSTYFRGHNFSSIKFIRKDTLFSLGGSGFWHVNNIETYYSYKLHEWELVHVPATEGPHQILKQFGGYDHIRDVVSVIESPPFYYKSVKDFTYDYFEKNLDTNEWKLLGEINAELLFKLGLKSLESEFLYGMYIFNSGPFVIIGNPVTNKIYSINKNITLISHLNELSERKGSLYSYYAENEFNKLPIKSDSISFKTLKSMGVLKGDFYLPKKMEMNWILLGGYILAAALLIYIFTNRKKQETNTIHLEGLPENSVDFLRRFLECERGHEFDSNQITEFMGYSTYSFETQRQLRSKLIKTTNSYFSIHYKMTDIIERKTAKDDKRFSVYSISEEHYDKLKDMLAT